jgi:phospholipid N-methyltransferase
MSVGDVVRFIRTWSTTGAIAPSGRALARRMVAHIDAASDDPILELGPGTGVVTRALLERGVAAERIVAVEFNEAFCDILANRYPGVRIARGDAYDLGKTLADIHEGPFASAVSSGAGRCSRPVLLFAQAASSPIASRLCSRRQRLDRHEHAAGAGLDLSPFGELTASLDRLHNGQLAARSDFGQS